MTTANVDLSELEDDITKSRGDRWIGEVKSCDICNKNFSSELYMIDGPIVRNGPWGNLCASCYCKNMLPLGIGRGQLYRFDGERWLLVGGYQSPLDQYEV